MSFGHFNEQSAWFEDVRLLLKHVLVARGEVNVVLVFGLQDSARAFRTDCATDKYDHEFGFLETISRSKNFVFRESE